MVVFSSESSHLAQEKGASSFKMKVVGSIPAFVSLIILHYLGMITGIIFDQ